jgi:hypothetical protein
VSSWNEAMAAKKKTKIRIKKSKSMKSVESKLSKKAASRQKALAERERGPYQNPVAGFARPS